MSTSFAGAAEVDDQLTPASSCGLLEARERLVKGPGCRWTLDFSLEVVELQRRRLCWSVRAKEDGCLGLF